MRPSNQSDFDNELVMRYVISYMSCGVCESDYRLEDVHIIDQGDGVWALVVQCPSCGAEGLVLAVASPMEGDEVEGDLFVTNWWDSGLAPLTERDVVMWREFLADFHGDMYDLLQAED